MKGKTIKSYRIYGNDPHYDDMEMLEITFTDGTTAKFRAWYGGYTGNSVDEYPAFIERVRS